MMYPHERLYLEYVPVGDDINRLVSLQTRLEKYGPKRPVEAARLHTTLLHVGKVSDVHNELQALNPALSPEICATHLQTFVDESMPFIPTKLSLQAGRMALYGNYRNVLALELEPTAELLDAHAIALGALRNFFKRCGVDDSFMQDSLNFKHALDLHPHLTLFKRFDGMVPAVNPGAPLQLQLAPIAGL